MPSSEKRKAITPQEAEGVAEMRETFPLGTTESFGMELDDACLVRYLRARDGNIEKASTMLTATLDWRREFGLPGILKESAEVLAKENSTGKVYMSGFDKHGRPIMVMRTRCENTHDHDGNILHVVYQMERARAILQRTSGGLDKICIVQDYVGFSLRNSPSMKTSLRTLNTLQNHYPETLGVAYFVSPPFVFRGFFKVIQPFIDKETKEKFRFVAGSAQGKAAREELSKNFDVEDLEEAFGGNYTAEYNSAVYLAAPMDQDFRAALAASSGRTALPASS